MSGYELARTFERTLAHAWSAPHSQIYPELRRLAEGGLIHVTEEGARGRKTYAITEQGLDAVRAWLAERERDRTSRNEATLRVFLLWLLAERDASSFLLAEADAHSRLLDVFEARRRELDAHEDVDDAQFAGRLALEWGLRYERAYVGWARWAADELSARRRQDGWGSQLRQLRARLRRRARSRARRATS